MRLRYRLACLAGVPLVALLCWLVLRDSGLFAVDQVTIVGLSSRALPAVVQQIDEAAHSQTTTDFSVGAVRAAVEQYTLITDIHAETQFPHGVRITVTERTPIAALTVGHHHFAIAADGSVITGLSTAGSLAVVHAAHLPAAGHTSEPFVMLALRILRDAPAPLRRRVAAVSAAGGPLTIYLHRGPRLIFGNDALPHAKWDSAAAVLADTSSRGATYVDVRLPSRPAAQVDDPATAASVAGNGGSGEVTPTGAATVATVLAPALIQPSSSTSG
jgi:cell division protein FtsQ